MKSAVLPQLNVPGGRERLRVIAGLTGPQLLMLLCQFVVGMTDVWAGGRIGSAVQASIGMITQCQMMLMILCMATVSGAVAAVSQSLGAGKLDRARRYVGLVCAAGLGAGALLALGFYGLREPFLRLLQTPEDIMPTASVFFNATMWAMPGHYGMTIGAALFRSAQSVLLPLYVGMGVALLNVAGDLGFGLGWWGLPAFGAEGLAWTTCVSVNLGALILLGLLRRERLLTRQSLPRWRWARRGAVYLLKVGGPALVTSALWQTGYLVLYMITASLPSGSVSALAGLTAGLRVEALLFLPATAFNMTASVLVGHCLGEGDKAEARRLAVTILVIGCVSMSVVGACLWPLRWALATFITPDPAVQEATVAYLSYNFASVPFTVASVILAGVFNGAGATVYPMWAFSISIWLVRLPLAWLFGHRLWMTASGVFMAMLVSQMVQALTLVWVLRCRDWSRFAMRRTGTHHHN